MGGSVKCRACGDSFVATYDVDVSAIDAVDRRDEREGSPFKILDSSIDEKPKPKHVSNVIDVVVALLDWRFQRYITPWVVRVTWIAFLALTAMWFLTIALGVLVSLLPFSPSPVGAEQPFPGFEPPKPEGVSMFAKYVAGLITMAVVSLMGILWVRVILEQVIVRFNMAQSLRALEEKLSDEAE